MEARDHRFGVVSAVVGLDVGEVGGELLDAVGEVPGAGDVVIADVAVGNEAEARAAAAGQLLDAGGDSVHCGFDVGDLVAHAAGGVYQEGDVEAYGTSVVGHAQGDGLLQYA